MANFTRETYYAALFALLTTSPGLKTVDRRVPLLENMDAAKLPGLFMAVGKQETRQQRGLPPIHVLGAEVFLYAANPDRTISADIVLNGLIDAVEAVLKPDPSTNVFTLGGLVSHCWIDADTEVFSGALGERAAAIVPIKMLVP